MRKVIFLVAASVFLSAGVRSAEELSVDLMQNIEDTNKSLSSNIALSNKAGATADAMELTQMFADVETFFDHKGDAKNAVDLARQSKELSTDIVGFVAANNFDSATTAATTLSRTCRTCHTFYKKE
jgi:ATP-dependent protease HslVU (ClpYQ) peptidase subunit